MATCDKCGRDWTAWRKADRPDGGVHLYWVCDGCFGKLSLLPRAKGRGLAFYRRLTYTVVMPLAAMIFGLVELGVHL